MTVSPPQLEGSRPRRLLSGRSVAAALPDAALALGFLFVLKRELFGPPLALPGHELVFGWCVFELIAIWLFPALYALFNVSGRLTETMTVTVILPLLLVATLVAGTAWPSGKLLCSGYLLLFVTNKCISFHFSSSSRRAREIFLMRLCVGGVAWVVSIVAAGLMLICAREIFAPARLVKEGLTAGTLLLSGALYFLALAALEVLMSGSPAAGRPAQAAPRERQQPHEDEHERERDEAVTQLCWGSDRSATARRDGPRLQLRSSVAIEAGLRAVDCQLPTVNCRLLTPVLSSR